MNRLKISLLGILVLWLLPAVCHAEKYALFIGMDKYANGANKLDSCIADLHGVADALQANCGYRPENIQFLVGEGKTKVTRQAILDAVAQMAARIHLDDTIFFFWSGHGIYLEGQDRVLPYDGDWNSLGAARRTTLPVQEMLAPLLQVRSKAVMLCFDMCRDDAVTQIDYHSPSKVVPPSPQPEQATTETTGPLQKVSLYSSTKGQESWMWKEKHRSIFGYFLRQAVAHSPKQEAPVLALANFYADVKHDNTAALGLYLRAVKLDSTDPYALIGLGGTYLRLKNPDRAEAIFREIMDVHSDNAGAVGNLAYLYESVKKDIPGAERLYLQAIAIDPTLAWVQNSLGWLYYKDKNEFAAGEKYFRKAVNDRPLKEAAWEIQNS